MRKRISISLLLCFSTAVSANALAADTEGNLAPNASVDAIFVEYAKPNRPGCALGVFQDGRVIYEKGYGLASLEHGIAIDPRRTVFDIGSTSKQFTAASLLLLVQDGKLSLDDDIRKFLPEIPDYGTPITIAHLLHHTSGLRDYTVLFALAGWSDADHTDDKDALASISRQKALNFATGSRFEYSNTGYFLMSLIVERVSGKRLAEFAHERIFAPLDMKDAFYLDDHQRVIPHGSTSYEPNPDGGFSVHMSNGEQTGDGAVRTTVADLGKWQQNYIEPKVGGRWLIEQMELRGKLDDGSPLGYASGLFIDDYHGLATIGHGGVVAGYRTSLLRFPSTNHSIAVLCNVGDAEPETLARQVADVYLEGKFPQTERKAKQEKSAPVIADTSPAPIGIYWSAEQGLVRRIEQSDGKLWYVRGASSRSELVPIGRARYAMLGVPIQMELVVLPFDGVRQKFQLVSEAGHSTFVTVEGFSSDAKALSEFAGQYSSDELGAQWSFATVNGKLTVKAPREEPTILEPMFKDAFLAGEILLRFQRDASGRVVSLLADAGGAQGLIFEKAAD